MSDKHEKLEKTEKPLEHKEHKPDREKRHQPGVDINAGYGKDEASKEGNPPEPPVERSVRKGGA